MLDHLELRTRRMDECVAFYAAVLEPLGYALVVNGPSKGFGHEGRLDFWLAEGEPSRDVHFAFTAPDRPTVDTAYARIAAAGGAPNRAPALAPHLHPNYYAGYALDPDGRLVEFVSHGEK
ncbi:MAG: VOC family protein [Sphingomonas sp.]|uniref:VOC family protein n=1 Tax=Sphingomonas sp. TaxID=28214 RepID=UPI0022728639|nr:VOC family protein [Sphingomonas sp.]MCX8477148.1 VOC family protein [Sphingomonas sp.]